MIASEGNTDDLRMFLDRPAAARFRVMDPPEGTGLRLNIKGNALQHQSLTTSSTLVVKAQRSQWDQFLKIHSFIR
jgi:hypothetical protein